MREETDIMGYWDCKQCGTKKIKGTLRDCPSCGMPRGKDVKFYMSGPDIELTEEEKETKGKGADWLCKCCGSFNSALDDTCTSCGAERTSDDYFSVKKKQEEESIASNEEDKEYASSEEDKDSEKGYKVVEKRSSFVKEKITSFDKSIIVKALLGVICAILLISGIVYAFSPKTHHWMITDKYWTSYVDVEQNRYVAEDDWYLPNGADLDYERSEIHHYDRVQDGTTVETYQSYEQVGSHTEERVDYSDNGDGTFHRSTYTVTVPDYGYVTRTRTVPKYKDVPVYQTKYYYHIWRWCYVKTLDKTEHGNKKVSYVDKKLGEKERYTNKRVKYWILYQEKEKEKKKKISASHYEEFDVDKTYKVKIQLGIIKEINEYNRKK